MLLCSVLLKCSGFSDLLSDSRPRGPGCWAAAGSEAVNIFERLKIFFVTLPQQIFLRDRTVLSESWWPGPSCVVMLV